MKVEINLEKATPWLKKKEARIFVVCLAFPESKSKKKIMLRINNKLFFTLYEIEEEIGEPIFTITE